MTLVRVAAWEDVPADGGGLLAEAGGRAVAVFRDGDEARVIEDKCPHRGAPLSDGARIGDEVRCPWHGARFDLRTGKATCGPAVGGVKVFEARVEGEAVWVEIPE